MAGKRQHYIPRFLQKGFCSKKTKKEVYTFVFTKEKGPYEPNLLNVGLERYFYGNPTESSADDKITDQEELFFEYLETLRTARKNLIVDPEICSAFVGHMILRVKHIRGSINEMGTTFVHTIKKEVQTQR